MLITKRSYKKKCVIGGAGIFGSIANSIDVGKTVPIDAGNKLVEKAAERLTTPKPQVANVIVPPEEITKKYTKL